MKCQSLFSRKKKIGKISIFFCLQKFLPSMLCSNKSSVKVIYIGPDKALFSSKKYRYFLYFSRKSYVVDTH